MEKKLQFDDVSRVALASFDRVMSWLGLGNGKHEGSEYVALNPTRGDKHIGSFKINTSSGAWCDFADETAKGRDLVSLTAYMKRNEAGYVGLLNNKAQVQALNDLGKLLGLGSNTIQAKNKSAPKSSTKNHTQEKFFSIAPVLDGAPAIPCAHHKHGKPSRVWNYLNENGELLFVVWRFDFNDKRKEFCPLSLWKNEHGKIFWKFKGLPEPRPLYGLDRLAKNKTALVVLCEGEKAADSAGLLFPDAVCMAWPNGVGGVSKIDFSPLGGRECLLWPDNDEAGLTCMHKAYGLLKNSGAVSVKIINPAIFSREKSFDAADAVEAGFTSEQIRTLQGKNDFFLEPLPEKNAIEKIEKSYNVVEFPKAPEGYHFDEKGFFFGNNGKKERVCGAFQLVARMHDEAGASWAFIIEFLGESGEKQKAKIPYSRLVEGREFREVVQGLQDRGFKLYPKGTDLLLNYLRKPDFFDWVPIVKSTQKTGWHKTESGASVYVMPESVISESGENEGLFYFPSEEAGRDLGAGFSVKGSLNDWQENVSRWCQGNSRLVFAVSCAFAASLMEFLGIDFAGFHFVGATSTGKSTCLNVAASVCGLSDQRAGGFIKSWRTTDSAVEIVCEAHNHALLPLDEIGLLDPKKLSQCVYMIGNGVGKARMSSSVVPRSRRSWSTLLLSTGEKGMAEIFKEAKETFKGGHAIRLLEIEAEVADNSVFETDHQFCGEHAGFSSRISENARQYHGAAFIEFVQLLCNKERQEEALNLYQNMKEKLQKLTQEKCGVVLGEISRAIDRFALVATAGTLASGLGVTGWNENETYKAVSKIYLSWLRQRGASVPLDIQHGVEHFLNFLLQNFEARCTDFERPHTDTNHAPSTANIIGVKKYHKPENEHGDDSKILEEVCLYRLAIKDVLGKYAKDRLVLKELVRLGYLVPDSEGKFTTAKYIKGVNEKGATTRVYVFNPKFLTVSDPYAIDD